MLYNIIVPANSVSEGEDILKLIGKKGLAWFIEILIKILMVCDVIVVASMPWWLEAYLRSRTKSPFYGRYFLLLLLSGLLAEVLMWQARRLIHNVNTSRPFIMENSRILRKIGICCVLFSAEYIIAIPFILSFFTALIGVAFAMVALLCFVFAELFRQAVIFKEENELTI